MELTINGKKAIDVFEGELQFFCELLDESGYSVKHDDKYELLWEDLRTSLNVIADERKCSGLILYALVDQQCCFAARAGPAQTFEFSEQRASAVR